MGLELYIEENQITVKNPQEEVIQSIGLEGEKVFLFEDLPFFGIEKNKNNGLKIVVLYDYIKDITIYEKDGNFHKIKLKNADLEIIYPSEFLNIFNNKKEFDKEFSEELPRETTKIEGLELKKKLLKKILKTFSKAFMYLLTVPFRFTKAIFSKKEQPQSTLGDTQSTQTSTRESTQRSTNKEKKLKARRKCSCFPFFTFFNKKGKNQPIKSL